MEAEGCPNGTHCWSVCLLPPPPAQHDLTQVHQVPFSQNKENQGFSQVRWLPVAPGPSADLTKS